YEAIVKGENIPEPGIPESFKVLIKKLQSVCLDVKVWTDEDQEIEVRETVDEDDTIGDFELDVGNHMGEVEESNIIEEIEDDFAENAEDDDIENLEEFTEDDLFDAEIDFDSDDFDM
ncbi:hypothetical protein, partial [Clostridioides difficile]|uniref:hypothetical protein n=1 Tax=Clostridioides difficile TaxID=1496 RepID=UPI00117A99A6